VRAYLAQVTSLSQPVALAVRNGDPALYFAQKDGSVVALRGGAVDPTPVVTVAVSTGGEQGLLGVVFSPDGSHIYINYTDPAGDTHVVEYAMAGGYANAGTRRELLFVDQPFANHNGGNLVFGPDGQLWIGLGDGGSGGDPNNNAQNPGTLLGKMLRMNVANAQPSIWAMGLRNPWRYSFDRATGSIWIADVGQSQWEEIDFAPGVQSAGINYGWARFEGNHVYNAARVAPNAVAPVYEYSHAGGNCSVTGGYVYRGSRIPALNGAYLFADFCAGHIFGLGGGQVRDLGMVTSNLSSFGEDLNGDVYAMSLNGPVYRIDPS
jgi:glucose/arabinose dehydrogenase